MITYHFDIVGGGFDGAPHMAWQDDGKHPPPPVIFVGVCPEGTHCGTSKCRRGAPHVSYWTPGEEGMPAGVERYRKQEEFVIRSEDDELRGRAVYTIGGLMDPRNFGAKARVPAGSGPMVTARVFVAPWEKRPKEFML
jgi:hypothetical protein